LVFNPGGAFLPPPQSSLEETYHKRLEENFDIYFNNLITIVNMPIGRFAQELKSDDEYENYLNLLKDTHNPDTVSELMADTRSTLLGMELSTTLTSTLLWIIQ
jgi:hypothetical protein